MQLMDYIDQSYDTSLILGVGRRNKKNHHQWDIWQREREIKTHKKEHYTTRTYWIGICLRSVASSLLNPSCLFLLLSFCQWMTPFFLFCYLLPCVVCLSLESRMSEVVICCLVLIFPIGIVAKIYCRKKDEDVYRIKILWERIRSIPS